MELGGCIKISHTFQFWLKVDKNNENFTWDIRMRVFRVQLVECLSQGDKCLEHKTVFLFSHLTGNKKINQEMLRYAYIP
jgi:hypothetical protein